MGKHGTSGTNWPTALDTACTEVDFGTLARAAVPNDISQAVVAMQGYLAAQFVDTQRYATFAEAITAIGVTAATLLVSSNMTISTVVTVPSNVSLQFTRAGKLTKSGSGSLIIKGTIVGNPKHQIFSGFAKGEVKIAQPVEPEWFATSGNGLAEDIPNGNAPYTVDFNVVDGATALHEYGTVKLDGDTHYRLASGTAPWLMEHAQRVYTVGGMAYIENKDAGKNAIETYPYMSMDFTQFEDLTIVGVRDSTGHGIWMQQNTRWRLKNVISKNHGGDGLFIEGNCWIGEIFGGSFVNNTGNGIKVISARRWQATKAYVLNQVIFPTTNTAKRGYQCTTAGTSGGSEPSWPLPPIGYKGQTISDGTVIWTLMDISPPVDAGAPNAISFFGVACEGNTMWGYRFGDSTLNVTSIESINIFGGTVETNSYGTSNYGGMKADYIISLNVYGWHLEDPITSFKVGLDGSVLNFRLHGISGMKSAEIGSQTKNFIYENSRVYEDGEFLGINHKGATIIRNNDFLRKNANELWIKERCPNATGNPSYYSSHNMGIKGLGGSLLRNGHFKRRINGATGAPNDWTLTNANIAYSDISGLNASAFGKIATITTSVADGYLSQAVSFPRDTSVSLYVSAWVKVNTGVGVIEFTDGTTVDRVERDPSTDATVTYWHRITIPYVLTGDVSAATIYLRGKNIGDSISFAEVQVVRDLDILGFRYYNEADAYELPGKVTWQPGGGGGIANNASDNITVSVLDAQMTWSVAIYPPYDLQGCTASGYVSSANTVTIVVTNNTGTTKTFTSDNWQVGVVASGN